MSRRQKDLFPELPDGKKYVSDIPELVAEWHPIKNENMANLINGPEPAKNILKTSLPSGSVPSRCAFEGFVGCGKTFKSNPIIGS